MRAVTLKSSSFIEILVALNGKPESGAVESTRDRRLERSESFRSRYEGPASRFSFVLRIIQYGSHIIMSDLRDVVLRIDEKKRIAYVVLSRPKARNAWTEAMQLSVREAILRAGRDDRVRVIIVTGDPDGRAFCAGADLSAGASIGDSFASEASGNSSARPTNVNNWRDGGGIAALTAIDSVKPIIAAINGPAVGVGLTFPCACDVRVAAADAKVGFAFVRRGLACESVSSWTLPRLVGMGKAQELVLTGRVFYAREAPPGLFQYVEKDAAAVMIRAESLAEEIAQNTAPQSVALSRLMLYRNSNVSPEKAHLIESKAIYTQSQSSDASEGVLSFLEKRGPRFTRSAWADLPTWAPWWDEIAVTKSNL